MQKLADFLLSSALTSRTASIGGNPHAVSRRTFLASSGAVAAAVPAAASTLAGFEGVLPTLYREGRVIVVALGSLRWRVDPTPFGATATARFRRLGDGWIVRLAGSLLPGTDFSTDFVAIIEGFAGGRIALRMPGAKFRAEAPLAAWLSSRLDLVGETRLTHVRLAQQKVELPVGTQLAFSPDWTWRLRATAPGTGTVYRINSRTRVSARGFAMKLPKKADLDIAFELLERSGNSRTLFAFETPALSGASLPLSRKPSPLAAVFRHDLVEGLAGEVFSDGSRDAAVFVLEACGSIGRPGFGGKGMLHFERVALTFATGARSSRCILAGKIHPTSHAIQLGNLQALVSGDDNEPFVALFAGRSNEIRAHLLLHELHIPVSGAGQAVVKFAGQPTEISFGGEPPEQLAPPRDTITVAANTTQLLFDLSDAKISLRRGADHFNLDFSWKNFDLKANFFGRPELHRRPAPGDDTLWPEAQLTVHFPPQHMADQWVEESTNGYDSVALPTVARLSGPSRLVFNIGMKKDGSGPLWKKRAISIEQWTDWSELEFAVNRRAAAPNLPFDTKSCSPAGECFGRPKTQMEVVGITTATSQADAFAAISKSLMPPDDDDTVLEMSSRLIFSPSAIAGQRMALVNGKPTATPVMTGWLTPRHPPAADRASLWSARLDDAGRKTVRALWSRMLPAGQYPQKPPTSELLDISLLPIIPEQQWEIMAQTSVYGLPALRRLGGTSGDPVDAGLKTLPNASVIPAPDYPYLTGLSSDPDGVGVMQPSTFTDADIMLTSLGGNFVADWRGEPPTLLEQPLQLRRLFHPLVALGNSNALDVERLSYGSQLGRDIKVEVVSKGFLFPLGIRASWVALTERQIVSSKTTGRQTALLIRRNLLVVNNPEKHWPAIYQPFGGREFPSRRLLFQTLQTPDIRNPREKAAVPPGPGVVVNANGRLLFGNDHPDGQFIFWPTLLSPAAGATTRASFKWSLDDNPTPIESQLIFVDNQAAADAGLMEKLVRYYRDQLKLDDQQRWAHFAGSRQRYAPPDDKAKEVAFDTDHWVLGVQGRMSPSGGDELFVSDARMNGADQPPFYPRVERAYIKLQTIERLLGHPVGLAEVGYHDQYINNGFDSKLNRAEIYLQLFGPDIDIDPAAAGLKGSAGGVANPAIRLAAFSRSLGPVGGTGSATPPSTRPALRGHLQSLNSRYRRFAAYSQSGHTQASPYDFSQTLNNLFDPSQYMGGIASAKLLGVVPLKNVIKSVAIDQGAQVPALIESIQYAADTAEGTVSDALRKVASSLGQPLLEGLQYLNTLKGKFGVPNKLTFADLYPDLDGLSNAAASSLATTLAAINDQSSSEAELIDNVTQTAAITKALVGEADRVISNPTPPLVDQEITGLLGAWQSLRALFNGQLIGKSALDQLRDPIVDLFRKISAEGLADVLVGYDTTDWQDAVKDPSAWAANTAGTLFEESFGSFVASFLTYLQAFTDEFEAALTLVGPDFVQVALPLLATSIDGITAELTADSKIFDPAIQQNLVDQIRIAIQALADQATSSLPSPTSISDLITNIETVRAAATSAAMTSVIQSTIGQFQADIIVNPGQSHTAVMATFEADFVPKIRAAAAKLLSDEASGFQADLRQLLASPQAAILRVAELLKRAAVAMAASAQIAAFSAAGQAVSGWCGAATGQARRVVDLADDFASGLLGDAVSIATSCKNLLDAVSQIVAPTSASTADAVKFEAVRNQLSAAIQALAATLLRLDDARMALAGVRKQADDLSQTGPCDDPVAFLSPVGQILAIQGDVIGAINQLPPLLDQLSGLGGGAFFVQPIADVAFQILELVTGIQGVATAKPAWTSTNSALAAIGANVGSSFQASLLAMTTQIVDQAAQLHKEILGMPSAASLAGIAAQALAFVETGERQLLGLVLQTAVFNPDTVRTVALISATVLGDVASVLKSIHTTVHDLLQAVVDALNHSTVMQLIINPAVLTSFSKSLDAIQADLKTISAIVDSATTLKASSQQPSSPLPKLVQNLDGLINASLALVTTWEVSPPAIATSVDVITAVATEILRGDITAVLNIPDLHMILNQIEGQAEAMLAALVPTRITLNYDWKTPLQPFEYNDSKLFKMQTDGTGLTLAVSVDVDILTQSRSATVTGTIDPFQIKLFGDADIATIYFDGAGFQSVNGSTPHFSARVSNVALGAELSFISALQSYFGQSDGENGFYVDVSLTGVEAGYVYAAPLIVVGDLEFLNIAVKVAATLPFDGSEAEFEFDFASADLPFLIAVPPYGGGGYVQLVSSIHGITRFELLFVFGGVAAITFGPLQAEGRLLAGVSIAEDHDHQKISAIVQAVGEGNIACFGICVAITVAVIQSTPGYELAGYSDYSFSFHIGWFKLSYGFRASYTITGGGGSDATKAQAAHVLSLQPIHGLLVQPAAIRQYQNLVPPKIREWHEYKSRYSMELLDS